MCHKVPELKVGGDKHQVCLSCSSDTSIVLTMRYKSRPICGWQLITRLVEYGDGNVNAADLARGRRACESPVCGAAQRSQRM